MGDTLVVVVMCFGCTLTYIVEHPMFVYFRKLSYIVVDCLTSIRGISYIFVCIRTLTYTFVQKLDVP